MDNPIVVSLIFSVIFILVGVLIKNNARKRINKEKEETKHIKQNRLNRK